ncbi:MAG TPA: SIMPL domain-containing protein [Naasia sp.]
MTDTRIAVRGEHLTRLPPERATVTLTVVQDGHQRESVVAAAADIADQVTQVITAATDAQRGPVLSWSSASAHVWAERPWTPDGVQQDLVHHASVRFSVVVGDFEFLGGFLGDVASRDGVSVEGISWSLTEETRRAVLDDVRTRAVEDAVQKATVYARSIGLQTVRATALADPGMLHDGNGAIEFADQPVMLRSAKAVDPGLSFRPEDIEVTAAVDARFLAT